MGFLLVATNRNSSFRCDPLQGHRLQVNLVESAGPVNLVCAQCADQGLYLGKVVIAFCINYGRRHRYKIPDQVLATPWIPIGRV